MGCLPPKSIRFEEAAFFSRITAHEKVDQSRLNEHSCARKNNRQTDPSYMFSEQIELRGHIIDSLILPKVLDEILTYGGTFTIGEVKIGKQRHDASYACIDVFGPSPPVVDSIV